jgi:hypothetical protein
MTIFHAWCAAAKTGTGNDFPYAITAAICHARYTTAKTDTHNNSLNAAISVSPVSIARTPREPTH